MILLSLLDLVTPKGENKALTFTREFWKLRNILLFCLLVVPVKQSYSAILESDVFEDAISDFNSGMVDSAVSKWTPLAEKGHPEAAFHLGAVHYFGDGTPVNYSLALRWFERAAQSGHLGSQFMLGLMYAEGHGVLKDLDITVDWFDKAVEK